MVKIERLIKIIKYIFKSMMCILYPNDNRCIVCKSEDIEGICKRCYKDITKCDKKDELCIGYYRGVLKELIINLKYKNDFESGDVLVGLIEDKFNEISKEYYLTFIPISKNSLKNRGYNQCEYIAKELGFRKGFNVIETLKRVKETKIQKQLTKEERQINIYNAFGVIDKSKIEGKKFILIDDVVTTGCTINEGIRVLKENGAIDVKIAILAKAYI